MSAEKWKHHSIVWYKKYLDTLNTVMKCAKQQG